MIKNIIAIDTYSFEEMIFQEITFLIFFGIGVIYSGKEGEHFAELKIWTNTICIENLERMI